MMKLFLDSLLRFAIAKPDSLTVYTQEMAAQMDELLAGVVVDEDDLMMSLFLDFATKDTMTNPQHSEAYTQEMSDEDDELLAGVVVRTCSLNHTIESTIAH
jgi:hypothetical protein